MNKRRNGFLIMARLIVLIKPLIHIMLIAVLFGIAGYLCAIFIPILGVYALLNASGLNIFCNIKTLFTLLIAFALLRGILRYIEQASNHFIAFKLLAVIRDKVFTALRRLCPAKLEGRDKGNLISLITSDIELLEVFYAHTISPILIAFFVSLIMVIFISCVSPVLGCIAAGAYIFTGVVIPLVNSRLVSSYGFSYRNKAGELNSLFLDSLRGLQELIQYQKTDLKKNEIANETDEITKLHGKLKLKEIFSINITDITVYSFNIIMIFTSAYFYLNNIISFSDFIITSTALLSSYGPVLALSSLSNNLAQTLASGERVLSLLEEEPVTKDKTDGKDTDFNSVSCQNVTFSYDKVKILDNVSIDIPPNKITGIYGKSGCGKSTLLKLIMRFWDKDKGSIILSGTEIKEINTTSLRKNESYCTQETYLFNDTIGNNIKIASENATDEDMINASKLASLHDFVSELPLGYDTPIGELGGRLSGGEKQRIGIARAFLSKAPLMLLDEPTSNLDSLNEAIILRSLKNADDKTVVLISHKRSTLAIADKIYSMDSERKS
ncbi:MAG: ABC transporter ATP-binding protein [Clostridia bacterium]|nr:ABC transporter ATP-binding protein [Clostridia bacterium]